MTNMENRGYGREEVEVLVWMISSLTFLVEDCLGSWGDRAEDEMEARGEGKTWYTLLSKYNNFSAVWLCQSVVRVLFHISHNSLIPEFLSKTSTMAKPLNCSSVRMSSVVPVMGEFALNVLLESLKNITVSNPFHLFRHLVHFAR